MSLFLLQLVGKWISIALLSIISLFNFEVKNEEYSITNDDNSKGVSVVTNVLEYETEKVYNKKTPKNISKTITEGKDGLSFIDNDGNEVIIEEVVNEVVEIGTGAYGVYKGIMTGYGPDCKTCSGRGFVACRTVDKKSFNLINDGVYYNDETYGEVRVLAAALSKFPCGTIVKIENSRIGDFMGIVLDTGYDMRKHYSQGIYHFDVAYSTEKDEKVSKTTDMSGKVVYNVQRWGW